MQVKTEKELGQALKNNTDTIEIEGNLALKTICIKATGKVAWAVAIGAIGVAVVAVIATPATAGASGAVAAADLAAAALAFDSAVAVAGGAAAGVSGAAVATTAVAIAVAGGGVGALNKLRKYKLEKESDDKVVLHRK